MIGRIIARDSLEVIGDDQYQARVDYFTGLINAEESDDDSAYIEAYYQFIQAYLPVDLSDPVPGMIPVYEYAQNKITQKWLNPNDL